MDLGAAVVADERPFELVSPGDGTLDDCEGLSAPYCLEPRPCVGERSRSPDQVFGLRVWARLADRDPGDL